tara:strand:+ start:1000 stop:1290 length:291 start_codon:yes stop_codon:yes gene_type:complete
MAGLDAAMAAGVFGQRVSVLLRGAAVFQLQQGQHSAATDQNVAKTIASMPLYDVESIYVDDTYWQQVNPVTDLDVTPITADCIGELIGRADHVLSF